MSAWVVAALVVFLTGVSKSGFAGALGGIAVPILATQMPVASAAAILLPILYAVDLAGVRVYRRHFSTVEMGRLLPGAIAGIACGALLFRVCDPRWIKVGVGVIALALAANRIGITIIRRGATSHAGLMSARWWSFIAGVTSTLAHSGGPPLFAYLGRRGLDRQTFIATASAFFFIVNIIKLLPYAMLGLLDATRLMTSVLLFPIVPVGVYVGVWLQRRIDERTFYSIFTIVLALSGGQLIASGLNLV